MAMLLGRKEAAHYLGLTPPQNILGVATGTGTLAYELALLGHDVVGIDLSGSAITQAQEKHANHPKLHFQQADATRLPFESNRFDASAISFSLHDMPYNVQIKTLEEMKRVTKMDGHILVVDYSEPKRHWGARLVAPLVRATESAHWSSFVTRGLAHLLHEVNLTIAKQTTYLGVVQMVVARNAK
jgi:ubiquinone/menaquinone biosynthesis C-methylase UbiE